MEKEKEKRSWLWKRKSSERSPGETESSTSISSHSGSYSDEKVEQEGSRKSVNHMQSSEVTSNAEVNDSFRSLTEKLSAALVNVGAKEDLVKQHAKVAEEAVAGWEKAENEVTTLRQQLEAAVQQNLALEVRVNHLDGALKECFKQLRQAREEQEQRIADVVAEKTRELEIQANKTDYHSPDILLKLESLEKENSALRFELAVQSEELEIRTIERDLSTQAAEAASRQQLESIKKVAKLEAECRRLQSLPRKSPSSNGPHKAFSNSKSSLYADSLTDSQSDSGEIDTAKMSKLELNESEQSCSNSWALALIAELDQFKNGKCVTKSVSSCPLEMNDIMDDFVEMERLASLSEGQNKTHCTNSGTELEVMNRRVCELEEKLVMLEAEKAKLENALNTSEDSLAVSNAHLAEAKSKIENLHTEMNVVNESKELLEFRLVSLELEVQTRSTEVDFLKADVEKERSFSSEMTVKYEQLEKELTRKTEEAELNLAACSNGELKAKQELAVAAADRLSECQKTISSLARQLESLATLEDFLIDTANLPGFSPGSSSGGGELWKLHSNDTFMPKKPPHPPKQAQDNSADESPPSSSSSSSSSAVGAHVGKLFSR